MTAEILITEINDTGMYLVEGKVYNTPSQFADAGFLRQVTLHNEYSLFDTNTAYHHHFYDAADGWVIGIPAYDEVLSRLLQAS